MASGIESRIDRYVDEVGELIASHGAKKNATDLTVYRNDPVGFIREVLKRSFYEMQNSIAVAVRDNTLVAVRGCNGSGKDFLIAAMALWWVFACRGLVLITGPTERQVKNIIMGEVRRMFTHAQNLPGDLYEMALRLDGEESQGIIAFTSSDASKITGYHSPRLLCCISESQGVDPMVFEGMFANATGTDSRIIAVGNPLFASGKFYDICHSPAWKSFTISAFDHPNLTGERNIPGAVRRAYCDRRASEFGVGSSIYRTRVLSEFPEEDIDALIQHSWLEAAALRWESGSLEPPHGNGGWVAAVDPARYGADYTALAIRQGPVVKHLVSWNKASTMETAERCERELLNRNIALRFRESRHDPIVPGGPTAFRGSCRGGLLVCDGTGVGSGVFDRLRQLRCNVHEFNAASASPAWAVDRFQNRRAYAYWGLRHLLEHDLVALPRDTMLWDELVQINWKTNLSGRIQIEAKEEIKARLGRSTDLADAVSMCTQDLFQQAGGVWRLSKYRT